MSLLKMELVGLWQCQSEAGPKEKQNSLEKMAMDERLGLLSNTEDLHANSAWWLKTNNNAA